MFRSAGANGTNGLYSPIANSDSSGFSEQRADLSSYSGSQGGPPGGYTTFNPAFRPVAGTGQGHIYDRSVGFFSFFGQNVIKVNTRKIATKIVLTYCEKKLF